MVRVEVNQRKPSHKIVKDTRKRRRYQLSYIINFYNEEKRIDLILDSLKKQSDKEKVELIFIDDNSTDKSLEKVLKHLQDMKYDYLVISNSINVGLRPARALGVEYASGKLLGTLDAHIVLEATFTEKIKATFENNEHLGAVGPMILPYGEKWFHKGMELQKKFEYRFRKGSKEEYVSGGAAIYRREPLMEIGGLRVDDVSVDIYTSVEFSKRGWGVKVLEDLTVRHYSPQTFYSFLTKGKKQENVRRKANLLSERGELLRSKTFWLKLSPLLMLFFLMGSVFTLYCSHNIRLLFTLTKVVGLILAVGFTILYGLYYSLSHDFTMSLYATLFVPFRLIAVSIKTLRILIALIRRNEGS